MATDPAALPRRLAERVRVLRDGAGATGEFVLCWLHHAVRGHENPALDVAVTVANERGLPVLVYQPILGTIRPRPTEDHAKRLDLGRYRDKVTRPARPDPPKVAVIGAGVSGLVAGRTLRDHGYAVTVFDKSRGAGGRISTRRHDDYAFDHGAQYFTARDPRFRCYVDSWVEDGVAARWEGRIAVVDHGSVERKDGETERYVGVPGMSAVARHLAADLDVTFNTRVGSIERHDDGWRLADDEGESLGEYGAVIVAVPPAQAAPLLAVAPELESRARGVEMRPCWAVMAVFGDPLDLAFDGGFVEDSPLSWIARNRSKPGRPDAECWVLHGSPEWSTDHLEAEPDAVRDALLDAFFDATGIERREPVFARAHRWRYSIAAEPLMTGCLWDADLALGACGDWCAGSRVEGAFLSGMAIAGRVLSVG